MQTILLIDDSMFTRRQITSMLKSENYNVIEAADGEAGMERIKCEKPDCIILDLLMPKKTGKEVLEALKEAGSETPVIVMSAEIQEAAKSECLNLGARAFLNKPPTKAELLEILCSALAVNSLQ